MEIRPSEEDIEQAKRIVNKIIFDYQLDRTTLFTVCNSFNDHISRLICAERIMGEMEKRLKSYDEATQKEGSEEEAYSQVYHELAFGGLIYRPIGGEELCRDIWLAALQFAKTIPPSPDAGREWISVSEKYPDGNINVLCRLKSKSGFIAPMVGKLRNNGRFSCEIYENELPIVVVTHWQEIKLPQPPKG